MLHLYPLVLNNYLAAKITKIVVLLKLMLFYGTKLNIKFSLNLKITFFLHKVTLVLFKTFTVYTFIFNKFVFKFF